MRRLSLFLITSRLHLVSSVTFTRFLELPIICRPTIGRSVCSFTKVAVCRFSSTGCPHLHQHYFVHLCKNPASPLAMLPTLSFHTLLSFAPVSCCSFSSFPTPQFPPSLPAFLKATRPPKLCLSARHSLYCPSNWPSHYSKHNSVLLHLPRVGIHANHSTPNGIRQ